MKFHAEDASKRQWTYDKRTMCGRHMTGINADTDVIDTFASRAYGVRHKWQNIPDEFKCKSCVSVIERKEKEASQ